MKLGTTAVSIRATEYDEHTQAHGHTDTLAFGLFTIWTGLIPEIARFFEYRK